MNNDEWGATGKWWAVDLDEAATGAGAAAQVTLYHGGAGGGKSVASAFLMAANAGERRGGLSTAGLTGKGVRRAEKKARRLARDMMRDSTPL